MKIMKIKIEIEIKRKHCRNLRKNKVKNNNKFFSKNQPKMNSNRKTKTYKKNGGKKRKLQLLGKRKIG